MDSAWSVLASLDGPEITIAASDLLEASLTDLRDEGTNSSAFGFNEVPLFSILNFLSSVDILLLGKCLLNKIMQGRRT
jgi:hypothetical protein